MRTRSGLEATARIAFAGLALAGAAAFAPAGGPSTSIEREVLNRPEDAPEPNAAGDILVRVQDVDGPCPPGFPEASERVFGRLRLRHMQRRALYGFFVDNPASSSPAPELFLRGWTSAAGRFHATFDTRGCRGRILGQGLPFGATAGALAGRNFQVRSLEYDGEGELSLGPVVLEGDFPGEEDEE